MSTKRSQLKFPLGNEEPFLDRLKQMWIDGWLDDFSANHFLIRAIENRLTDFIGKQQAFLDNTTVYPVINENNFTYNFLTNFSMKMNGLCNLIGENEIKKFVQNQLSAGKDNYSEEQFFRAMSEISIITYFCSIHNWKSIIYEPQINGKKNPEIRLISQNDEIIDIEVKTPGFNQSNLNKKKLMPTVLLTEEGKKAIEEHCRDKNIKCIMPRVDKLKDYINSAAEKFEKPKDNKHLNLLFINWSYSEFSPDAYLEAYSLLANPINGIITNKEIGQKLGIREDAYDKISAILVYSDSINGLTYLDLRYIWIKQKFRLVALQSDINYFGLTGINVDTYPEEIICVLGDEYGDITPKSPTLEAISIIKDNILKC